MPLLLKAAGKGYDEWKLYDSAIQTQGITLQHNGTFYGSSPLSSRLILRLIFSQKKIHPLDSKLMF